LSTVEVIILAIIQGLTEFLPISSSAHLILPSAMFGWEDQGLVFDVAVHVGTLLAVMLYFRRDIGQLTVGWSYGRIILVARTSATRHVRQTHDR